MDSVSSGEDENNLVFGPEKWTALSSEMQGVDLVLIGKKNIYKFTHELIDS